MFSASKPTAPTWLRLRFVFLLMAAFLGLCFCQRLIYTLWIRAVTTSFPSGLVPALAKGVVFDLATCAFLFLPLFLWLALAPARWRDRRFGRGITLFFSVYPLLLTLNTIGFEFFFWDEFQARYNFIAVDYLVYTHEVVRNIWESYPVVWFFLGLFAIVGALVWKLRPIARHMAESGNNSLERVAVASVLAAALVLNLSLDEEKWLRNDEFWGRELAKNSLFALFSAYNRNSIDYKQFYISMESKEAREITHGWLRPGATAASTELSREVKGNGPEKNWNVVLVAIESMSARFLAHYGNEQKLTPNLDRFADEGIFFNKLYATGSRTVRGLEAIMLALPPTPGQSIVRRPDSGNLFSLGSVFADRGYLRQFIYGGFGRFDNMGPWFASNGFDIIDRTEFAPGGITFSTAWGACDEDLFDEALRRADAAHEKKEKFFQFLLTTSNHRPYDFPNGRIDIPSHTGRDGAVKYTDYAIGRFVELAKKKPWYKDTIFIFAADHNASVAGGTDIPIGDYLIPVIFHNPQLIKPQVVSKLASQIDLAPTLLGLMNFNYRSWFFGQNLFTANPNRALIGTYQKIALHEPGTLAILEPGRRAEVQQLDSYGRAKETLKFDLQKNPNVPELVKRTAAIYQSASEVFFEKLSRVRDHVANSDREKP